VNAAAASRLRDSDPGVDDTHLNGQSTTRTSIVAVGDVCFTSTRAVDTANGRVVPKRSTNLELRGEDIFNFRSDNGNLTCVITNIRMTSGEVSKSRNGLFKRRRQPSRAGARIRSDHHGLGTSSSSVYHYAREQGS
jgi:hypothetical protein